MKMVLEGTPQEVARMLRMITVTDPEPDGGAMTAQQAPAVERNIAAVMIDRQSALARQTVPFPTLQQPMLDQQYKEALAREA